MAQRMYYKSTPSETKIVEEHLCEFKYYIGFSVSQKQKCIMELHKNIKEKEKCAEVLEISTKSMNPLGVKLSAFNLKFFDRVSNQELILENVFQSSKVFQKGGPYTDLLFVHPREAKRDERLKTSGKLLRFCFNGKEWALSPSTMFYDWLYMSAVHSNSLLSSQIIKYNIFTDIEFNHEKSINCQAHSAAIYVSLSKLGMLEKALSNMEFLKSIYTKINRIENLTNQSSMIGY